METTGFLVVQDRNFEFFIVWNEKYGFVHTAPAEGPPPPHPQPRVESKKLLEHFGEHVGLNLWAPRISGGEDIRVLNSPRH